MQLGQHAFALSVQSTLACGRAGLAMFSVFHHFCSPESALLQIMIQETFEVLRFPLAGSGAPFGHTGLPFSREHLGRT